MDLGKVLAGSGEAFQRVWAGFWKGFGRLWDPFECSLGFSKLIFQCFADDGGLFFCTHSMVMVYFLLWCQVEQ